MNASLLSQQILTKLNDVLNTYYPVAAVGVAAATGVREFSRYRKVPKRYGVGTLFSPTSSGANTAILNEGMFNLGDSVVFDNYTSNAEMLVIQSIAIIYPTISNIATSFVNPQVQVTFTTNTVHNHAAGAFLEQVTPGLKLVVGQTRYPLSPDLFRPDFDSIEKALGLKMNHKMENGYYDLAMQTAGRYNSGVMGNNYGYSSGGIGGTPGTLPTINANGTFGNAACAPRFRLYMNDQPYLEIFPAPKVASTIQFDYFGTHNIQSLPSSDSEGAVLYACYILATSRAVLINEGGTGLGDFETADGFKVSPHNNSEALQEMAKTFLDEYKAKTSRIPFLTSG